jgi:type IV pilus assembly protein PilQ
MMPRAPACVLALAAVVAAAAPAAAEGRDACPRDARYRGATIDLDLRDADLRDLFRLLAQVGGINVVVGDGVQGTVTLQVRGVPWTQVLCTVAHSKRLRVTVDRRVYLIRPAPPLPVR